MYNAKKYFDEKMFQTFFIFLTDSNKVNDAEH